MLSGTFEFNLRDSIACRDFWKQNEVIYLGSLVLVDGSVDAELKYRLGERTRVMGGLVGLWRTRAMFPKVKVRMEERKVNYSVTYGSEFWC